MLAPAVMISACGLLLLGMNNKYSIVVNRIRLLNEEKRKFAKKASDSEFNFDEEVRLNSIDTQLTRLSARVGIVRNAVLCYSLAVALFVLTSFLIGTGFLFDYSGIDIFVVIAFTLGMLMVLFGVAFAFTETKRGYEIVQYEIKTSE
ncbi:MAG: DUF2721 domain-containing protein [Ignavibacteriaceae bacterium]|nr:DUF2721 domain-containing protein [Ignavibacteriaceae bacterium]